MWYDGWGRPFAEGHIVLDRLGGVGFAWWRRELCQGPLGVFGEQRVGGGGDVAPAVAEGLCTGARRRCGIAGGDAGIAYQAAPLGAPYGAGPKNFAKVVFCKGEEPIER